MNVENILHNAQITIIMDLINVMHVVEPLNNIIISIFCWKLNWTLKYMYNQLIKPEILECQ